MVDKLQPSLHRIYSQVSKLSNYQLYVYRKKLEKLIWQNGYMLNGNNMKIWLSEMNTVQNKKFQQNTSGKLVLSNGKQGVFNNCKINLFTAGLLGSFDHMNGKILVQAKDKIYFEIKQDYLTQYTQKCYGIALSSDINILYKGYVHCNKQSTFGILKSKTTQHNAGMYVEVDDNNCVLSENYVFFTKREESKKLEIKFVYNKLYFINFRLAINYLKQYTQICNGNILWRNGHLFRGQIQSLQVNDRGKYITANGVIGFKQSNAGIIYSSHSGICRQLSDDGQYAIKFPYSMQFQDKSTFTAQYSKPFFGRMSWLNGISFRGAILCNLPQIYGDFQQNGETGMFFRQQQEKGILYWINSGEFGEFDDFSGGISINEFTLNFVNKFDYISQNNSPCKGIIKWLCGSEFRGDILRNRPHIYGDFYDKEGHFGILIKECVYMYESGEFGILNYDSGKIDNVVYQLFFKQPKFYTDQVKEHGIQGLIKWPGGSFYQGIIFENLPDQQGEYIDDIGQIGQYYNGFVYFNESKQFGQLDIISGQVKVETYTLNFLCKDDFQKQFTTKCKGTMRWPNQCIYEGTIFKNEIEKGTLTWPDKKKIIVQNKGNNTLINVKTKQNIVFNLDKGELM